jgi:oligo-1,6-glucosidase
MGFTGAEHYAYTAHVHDHLREMNKNVFSARDVVSIGETPGVGLEGGKLFTHDGRGELNMIFNFDHLETGGHNRFDDYAYDLDALKAYYIHWQTQTGPSVWPANYFENHDNPRMISKVTKEKRFRQPVGKMLAVLALTLKGTPFIFQGQELGAVNSEFDSIGEFNDVESLNLYRELKQKGEMSEEEMLAKLNAGTRDHSRAPMAWDDSESAGFTDGTPWLKANPNSRFFYVRSSKENPDSVLAFYKRMIQLRKKEKTLVYGDFIPYQEKTKHYFAYYRKYKGSSLFIEINLSDKKIPSRRPDQSMQVILSSYQQESSTLNAYEARIYTCL